jgi:hypothetical protein
LLLIATFGEAAPLLFLASENSWVMGCAMTGAAATSAIATIDANSTNFLNSPTSF